jgi:hypothetical protein
MIVQNDPNRRFGRCLRPRLFWAQAVMDNGRTERQESPRIANSKYRRPQLRQNQGLHNQQDGRPSANRRTVRPIVPLQCFHLFLHSLDLVVHVLSWSL